MQRIGDALRHVRKYIKGIQLGDRPIDHALSRGGIDVQSSSADVRPQRREPKVLHSERAGVGDGHESIGRRLARALFGDELDATWLAALDREQLKTSGALAEAHFTLRIEGGIVLPR